MEVSRCKAFLRLSGESLVDRDDEIVAEFKGFAQALKRTGIEYSIVLNIEDRAESSNSSHDHSRSRVHDSPVTMGGD